MRLLVGWVGVLALLGGCVPCTPERCCAGAPQPSTTAPAQPEPVATPRSVKETYLDLAKRNICPEGVPFLQDTWRFVGETHTPEFQDTLEVTGTRFTEHLSGRPDGTEVVHGKLEGEIRCIEDNRVLVQVELVTPKGAFGNHAGDAYPCDVLTEVSGRSRRMLLVCFFDWDLRPVVGREFEYERVATP